MNPKLLTADEKAQNRRGRNRRNARRQAKRRREILLREVALAAGTESDCLADLVTAHESLDLLTAHLHRSRSIASRLKRTVAVAWLSGAPASPILHLERVERPARSLRRRHRSQILPQLLDGALARHSAGSVLTVLAEVEEQVRRGISHFAALDFLVGACGLPWQESAELLFKRGVIPARLSPVEIEATRLARTFWDGYAESRLMLQAALAADDRTAAAGDWALFDSGKLAALLPGVVIPKNLRRLAYLTNLVRDRGELCLDIHSLSHLPLIRHPF